MTSMAAVAVVGAGPYGLSVAAHLSAMGLEPLVFGPPMESWRNGMPRGMRLKSEGFASCLSDPEGAFTLGAFCASQGMPYADLDLPVPVETFTAYGVAFQERFVPQLDRRHVRRVERTAQGFALTLEDGTSFAARQVVVATGLGAYRHIPSELRALTPARLSHTCEHADYSAFAGRTVAVVGAGASAIDAAAALHRAGASVRLIGRSGAVTFYAAGPRRWSDRFTAPMTPLGPGWKKLLCVKAPLLFHVLPERLRVKIVRRYLGPAPGFAARDDFEGKVAVTLSSSVVGARETATDVELEVATPDGRRIMSGIDHVIAGTGYDIDVRRLPFLDPSLVAELQLTRQAPRLSSRFETSVPGLFVVGTAAAYAFGPMLRFVCGAGFAARRVAGGVAAAERRRQRGSHAADPGRERARRGGAARPRPAPEARPRPPVMGTRHARMSTQPRLLFVTLLSDVGSDRIIAATARLGCACAVLGPKNAFAARSRHAGHLYRLPRLGGYWARCLFLRGRLERIVRDWRPDLVVPLDDLSARRLRDHRLLRKASVGLRRLIEASLGQPESYATICSREMLIDLAREIGVRTPAQKAVGSVADAKAAAATLGYPVVLKREQTCGGFGVAIVADEPALEQAFRTARWKAGTKRRVQSLLGLDPLHAADLVLQSYVPGGMAFQVVACARGIVLDSISFSAERIDPPVTGASTVLRAIARADMDAATRTLVAALGCSGLVSLDFIVSEDGASLIELNPRPVVSGHLGRLYGHDIYRALVEHWRGVPVAPLAELAAGPERVALFPRELDRDPESPIIDAPDVLHDLPWEDLDVVEAYAGWLQRRHPAHKDQLRQRLPLDGVVTPFELRRMVTSLDRSPT